VYLMEGKKKCSYQFTKEFNPNPSRNEYMVIIVRSTKTSKLFLKKTDQHTV